MSAWLSEGQPFSDVSAFVGDDCFSKFFTEQGYLELGEFLLADETVPAPAGRGVDGKTWQEVLFSRQVTDIIQVGTREALKKACEKESCKHEDTCPFKKEGAHSLEDVFAVYSQHATSCDFIGEYSTSAAITELCAVAGVRYVVTYNFDTVIEEMLYDALTSGRLGNKSKVREIHIWTFGALSTEEKVLDDSGSTSCSVILHQGAWEDPTSLRSANAIHFFHVHGVAPGEWLLKEVDIASHLIFSQHSYEVYQGSLYNWSNQVMQYLFSKYNVLAVGFSGTDANFRSFMLNHNKSPMKGLLVDAQPHVTKTFFLKARQPYREAIKKALSSDGKKCAADTQERLTNFFLKYCTDMIENYYKSYYKIGIEWVDDYTDVADTLHDVALAANGRRAGRADRSGGEGE
jgi:hypothetical protein